MRNALTQCVLELSHLHQHILTLFWLGLIDPLGAVLNQAVSKSKTPQNVTLSSTLLCMQTCHTFLHSCVDAILGFVPPNWLLWYQLAKTLHVQLNTLSSTLVWMWYLDLYLLIGYYDINWPKLFMYNLAVFKDADLIWKQSLPTLNAICVHASGSNLSFCILSDSLT
jgi:hypothetical protein